MGLFERIVALFPWKGVFGQIMMPFFDTNLGCLVLSVAVTAPVTAWAGPGTLSTSLQEARAWSGLSELILPDGQRIQTEQPLKLASAPGGRVKAALTGDAGGSVQLQQWKGHIRAVVRSPRRGTWVIQESPDGTQKVTKVDLATLGGCPTETIKPVPVSGIDGDDGGGGGLAGPPADGDSSASVGDGPVDVFVAYTNLARANAGSVEAMETAIQGWIHESNDVYRDSESTMRVRLVGTGEVSYAETGGFSSHLDRLYNTSDGFMDIVHTWRNNTGADAVLLIVDDSSGCGLAYTIKNPAGIASQAFGAARDVCADVQYSFTHELGHILGCCQDAAHPGSCASSVLYPYAFGYRFFGDTGNWRSVMAYTDSSSDPEPQINYTRIGHLSNPDVDYDGASTGTALADNARTHDSMSLVTSGYRAAVAPMSCLGDVQNDLNVGVADLLGLLGAWGPMVAGNAVSQASDLNGDAEIDVADLLIVLTEFGPCPS